MFCRSLGFWARRGVWRNQRMSPVGVRGATVISPLGQVLPLRKVYGCDHRVAGSAAEHSAILFLFSFLFFFFFFVFACWVSAVVPGAIAVLARYCAGYTYM